MDLPGRQEPPRRAPEPASWSADSAARLEELDVSRAAGHPDPAGGWSPHHPPSNAQGYWCLTPGQLDEGPSPAAELAEGYDDSFLWNLLETAEDRRDVSTEAASCPWPETSQSLAAASSSDPRPPEASFQSPDGTPCASTCWAMDLSLRVGCAGPSSGPSPTKMRVKGELSAHLAGLGAGSLRVPCSERPEPPVKRTRTSVDAVAGVGGRGPAGTFDHGCPGGPPVPGFVHRGVQPEPEGLLQRLVGAAPSLQPRLSSQSFHYYQRAVSELESAPSANPAYARDRRAEPNGHPALCNLLAMPALTTPHTQHQAPFGSAFPETFPFPGPVHGAYPGAFPGPFPGPLPGAFPGAFPTAFPFHSSFPSAFPGPLPGRLSGPFPFGFPANRMAVPRALPVRPHRAVHSLGASLFKNAAQRPSLPSTLDQTFGSDGAPPSTRTSSSASTQTTAHNSAPTSTPSLLAGKGDEPHVVLDVGHKRQVHQPTSSKMANHRDTKSKRRPTELGSNPALNLPMLSLKIGSLVMEGDPTSKLGWKFKVVFSKRRFMYEFESCPATEDGDVRLTCVIVPFQAVFALRCEEGHVTLQVESGPVMFLGRQSAVAVQERKVPMAACLATHLDHFPVHKVQLSVEDVSQVKTRLWRYSPRFHDLMLRPMGAEDTRLQQPLPPYGALGRSAIQPTKTVVRQPSRRRAAKRDSETSSGQRAASGCSCVVNCRGTRCSCAKARTCCEPGQCTCISCDNPLNFLSSVGIRLQQAREDPCLMQAIYKVSDLARYLGQQVRLNCCSESVTVRDCIPGRVTCPRCAMTAQYSWCANTFFHGPTNHCSVCMRCNLFAGTHCQKCNACYYFGLGSNSCPVCQSTGAAGLLPVQVRPPNLPTPRLLLPKPAPQKLVPSAAPGACSEDPEEQRRGHGAPRSTDSELNPPELQEHELVDVEGELDDVCQTSELSCTPRKAPLPPSREA